MKILKDNYVLLINPSHVVTATLSLIGAITNAFILLCTWLERRTQTMAQSSKLSPYIGQIERILHHPCFLSDLIFYCLHHHPATLCPFYSSHTSILTLLLLSPQPLTSIGHLHCLLPLMHTYSSRYLYN